MVHMGRIVYYGDLYIMMNKLLLFGAGETARLALEYFSIDSDYDVIALVVDDHYSNNATWLSNSNIEVISSKNLEMFSPKDYHMFCALGSSRLNRDRYRVYLRMKSLGYELASYISSRAYLSPSVTVGEHAFILEGNVIQSGCRIGSNVTLWSGNHVGHGSIIGDNVFVSSHVVMAGFSRIGDNTFIGINSTVCDNVSVAKDNFIGAGSLISKDTGEREVYRCENGVKSAVNSWRFCKLGNHEMA